MLAKGTLIDSGRFRIDGLITSGSSTDIYRAFDSVLNTEVVVKVFRRARLLAEGTSPLTEKIYRQLKALSQCSHRGIVTVYKCGHLDGSGALYIVEELLSGQTLRARLNRENNLACNEAVKIAIEIAKALEYAHQNGILHLDINPENVMLDANGDERGVKLLGFSVEDSREDSNAENVETLGSTEAGAKIKKSLAFMSPEQCRHEELDQRSDI